ncbi:putative methionine--tRNA ligase, mitochondrial [Cyphellophora attinorum]|uniref:Putative methionine--tRNA ligase, mitochondrial n=1 Tax=Cyphellophora attinorum TaxID=1664694 RepID=A0A0N1P2H2_9EURO|nr:putative methionine--tRNA ligase, mitochondrial [Phialophora attinorum]KPI45544.1 putative methionine--tRNA ligase, mitochondrial [Phialophora attinorum]
MPTAMDKALQSRNLFFGFTGLVVGASLWNMWNGEMFPAEKDATGDPETWTETELRRWLKAAKKPFYVTTPIFYVNSSPHVGHLYSMILADIFKRWQLLKRRPAQLLTGTDEHGVKVQRAAQEAGSETLAFCTKHAEQFKLLADTANISYDRFMRTTDSDHKDAVTYFWQELDRQGYIYQAKHEGWYCVSDETFYPENQVHAILVPATGEKIMASKETGKEVTWTSETNYHFRLSDFRERLLKHYTDNPDFIVPRERMNFIINEVEGLKDLSISRPKERLSWGIPVPGDPDQTMYVWFDALINYITHAGTQLTMKAVVGRQKYR